MLVFQLGAHVGFWLDGGFIPFPAVVQSPPSSGTLQVVPEGLLCNAVSGPSKCMVYLKLYNNPSYSRILIGSCLWSIWGQTHNWRHHYRVFAPAVLQWGKVLRIRIIFYVTGQKIRYKKVLPKHWTGSRSQKAKDKGFSFRKWYGNNFLAALVGSWATLNHPQTWSW